VKRDLARMSNMYSSDSALYEALENKEITLEHLRTVDMVADILTKPLPRKDFQRLRRVLLDPKLYCT